jgi:hypothetical protein
MEKIKQISEFSKMFKINIPIEDHFEYYVETLAKSDEFKEIKKLVNEFAGFEKWIIESGYSGIVKFS